MWYAAGGVVIILAVIWAAYTVGKRHGKTEEKKDDAETRTDEMARDANIAARPTPARPLSSMLPKA